MENLKRWRKLHGVSQQDIADMLGIDRSLLSRIESYERTPSIETGMLLQYMDTVAQDLLGRAKVSEEVPLVYDEQISKKLADARKQLRSVEHQIKMQQPLLEMKQACANFIDKIREHAFVEDNKGFEKLCAGNTYSCQDLHLKMQRLLMRKALLMAKIEVLEKYKVANPYGRKLAQ